MAEKLTIEQSMAMSNAAMSEEEKKLGILAMIEAIKKLLRIIREKMQGKGNIIQQKFVEKLNELENDLAAAVERNEVTEETLGKVLSIVQDLDGKIDTITAENVDKTLKEFSDGIDGVVRDLDAEHIQVTDRLAGTVRDAFMLKTQTDPELYKRFGLKNENELYMLLTSKEFEQDFLKEANVIECTDLKAKHQLLLEYKGEVFLATSQFSKGESNDTRLSVTLTDSPYSAEEIKADSKKFKAVEFKASERNAEHAMMGTFCKQNGYQYLPRRIPLERLTPQQNFIRNHLTKEVTSGNVENVIDNDGNYRVRNVETGDMLVASSENGEIVVTYYPNTENISDIDGKNHTLGSWKAGDEGHIHSEFVLGSVDIKVSKLLRSNEMQEYLEASGISKEMQKVAFTHETDTEWARVATKEGNDKVDALYEQCKETVSLLEEMDKAKGITNTYTVRKVQSHHSTFINVSDGTNIMAFSFDENGNPNTINYKDGESEKFKPVYNLQTNMLNDNFIKYQTLDRTAESFNRLHKVMETSLDELMIERGTFKETRDSEPKDTDKNKETRKEAQER